MFKFFIVLFLLLAILGCQPITLEEIKKVTEQDTFPIATIKNASVYYSDSGRVTMHILAPIIKNYIHPNEVTILEGDLKGNFYDSIGNVQSIIYAKYAKLDDKNAKLELRKDVKVFNIIDNTEFYSEELVWNRRSHIITSTKFIRIVTPDKIIWGEGFSSDEELKNYEILHPKGELYIDNIWFSDLLIYLVYIDKLFWYVQEFFINLLTFYNFAKKMSEILNDLKGRLASLRRFLWHR